MPLPQFQSANVATVTKISADHPVFCVTMNDGNRYVIKAEGIKLNDVGRDFGDKDTQQKSMHFGFHAMQKVVRGPNARPLDHYEISDFYSLRFNPVVDGTTKQEIRKTEKERTTSMLVIMDLVDGLKEAESMGASGDAVEVRKMLVGLFTDESLELLGRLIVVDLFIGNEDRFSFANKNCNTRALDYDTLPNAFRGVISNFGNVAFKKVGDDYTLIGFDPWDRSKPLAQLDQDLLTLVNNPKEDWTAAKILTDKNKMKSAGVMVLNSIIKGLLELFPPTGATDPVIWKPSTKDYDKVYKGMKKGADDLRVVCKTRAGNIPGRVEIPAGVASRMKALGWK
jgi:hypothetical protein